MVTEALRQIRCTLDSFGKNLCLGTRVKGIMNRAGWRGLERWRAILQCAISLCVLHESIIADRFPTAHTKSANNIYGINCLLLLEYPLPVIMLLNTHTASRTIAKFKGQFNAYSYERHVSPLMIVSASPIISAKYANNPSTLPA